MNSRYMVIPMIIAILDIAKGIEKEENSFMKIKVFLEVCLISIISLLQFVYI